MVWESITVTFKDPEETQLCVRFNSHCVSMDREDALLLLAKLQEALEPQSCPEEE